MEGRSAAFEELLGKHRSMVTAFSEFKDNVAELRANASEAIQGVFEWICMLHV